MANMHPSIINMLAEEWEEKGRRNDYYIFLRKKSDGEEIKVAIETGTIIKPRDTVKKY